MIGVKNIEYVAADLQTMAFDPAQTADFVLLYGLIYHLEDPVHTIRLASQMARKHILIETQVFPYDISGQLEDGHYKHMRPIAWSVRPDFGSCLANARAARPTSPSCLILNALLFLLHNFGFSEVFVLPSADDDYEQFRRGIARRCLRGQALIQQALKAIRTEIEATEP